MDYLMHPVKNHHNPSVKTGFGLLPFVVYEMEHRYCDDPRYGADFNPEAVAYFRENRNGLEVVSGPHPMIEGTDGGGCAHGFIMLNGEKVRVIARRTLSAAKIDGQNTVIQWYAAQRVG